MNFSKFPPVTSTVKYVGSLNTCSRLNDEEFRPYYTCKRRVQAVSAKLQANSVRLGIRNGTAGKRVL